MALIPGLTAPLQSSAEDYLTREAFLSMAFADGNARMATLWLTAEARRRASQALRHAPDRARIRFWQEGERSAWILDEIGKDQPISFGIVIDAGQIVSVQVLAFRESRGWEIRHPFFTQQFAGAALTQDGNLNRAVDGITGATLSVRAADRAARLALWLAGEAQANVATR